MTDSAAVHLSWGRDAIVAFPAPPARGPARAPRRGRGFTLVELIVVMVLMLIVASLVAPRMSSFFRGRVLSQEARRMLSLINYARSRAIAEGVPMLVWIDAPRARYGLEAQPSYDPDDTHAVTYEVDPTLQVDTAANDARTPVDPDADDPALGVPDGLPVIRFTPDGFVDEISVAKIILRQGNETALQIVPAANRLAYEIRPYSAND